MQRRISNAFDEAVGLMESGKLPDKKTAYMLLLRNCERDGVTLPRGAFPVAKMIDGILSQQDSFRMSNVVDDAIEDYLVDRLTFQEVRLIGFYSCFRSFMGWNS